MDTDQGSDATTGPGRRNLHVVERGDSWEVWRRGDSMPLGTYVTRIEAEERAQAQAADEGVEVEDHDLQVPPEVGPDAEADDPAGGGPAPDSDALAGGATA